MNELHICCEWCRGDCKTRFERTAVGYKSKKSTNNSWCSHSGSYFEESKSISVCSISYEMSEQIWLLRIWWLLGNHCCRLSSPSVSANNSEVDENPAMILYLADEKTISCNNEEFQSDGRAMMTQAHTHRHTEACTRTMLLWKYLCWKHSSCLF